MLPQFFPCSLSPMRPRARLPKLAGLTSYNPCLQNPRDNSSSKTPTQLGIQNTRHGYYFDFPWKSKDPRFSVPHGITPGTTSTPPSGMDSNRHTCSPVLGYNCRLYSLSQGHLYALHMLGIAINISVTPW